MMQEYRPRNGKSNLKMNQKIEWNLIYYSIGLRKNGPPPP